MPVHSHDGAEGLEPEGMGEPAQEFVAAEVMNDRLREDCTELCHARAEPGRNMSAVQGKISAAGFLRHHPFVEKGAACRKLHSDSPLVGDVENVAAGLAVNG